MTYSPLSYRLDSEGIALLKEYSLTHSDMLAQYNKFYFYLMASLCLSAVIFAAIAPNQEDLIQTTSLVLPVLICIVPKYIAWLYMGMSSNITFIYLFSSEDAHEVFRRVLVLDILIVSLIASIGIWKYVKKLPESIFACLLGMVGINIVRMWLYGLFSVVSPFDSIVSFAIDSLGTLIALCVSGFVQFVIRRQEAKKKTISDDD